MPTSFDKTYHFKYSAPSFTSEVEKDAATQQRVEDLIFEDVVPELPTREKELAYLEWLENDIREDPIFAKRYYKAGPMRIPFKNYFAMRQRYAISWWAHFAMGIFFTWPLGIAVGRWYRRNSSGVPIVKGGRHNHVFFDLRPTFRASR